ncbi:MAG: LysM peptidoglycan-binding domain-containing protein [Sinobacteraceae bacterium]|nr:LysM peptidoglycan-binding domain-containing protein [Nevskiaceae bacterium]
MLSAEPELGPVAEPETILLEPVSESAAPPGPVYADLFERLRAGFLLDDPDRQAIDSQLAWYARNPEYLERTFSRAELYMHHIVAEVERRGMPLELALLPVIESAFEPYAYSSARASGLWQFIPRTGTRFGMPQNWWYDGRRDVLESTRAALDYLQFLHDEFDGDWLLAVAGYNCGEGCVARAVRENRAAGRKADFWNLRLPKETRAYVPKLLAMKRLVQSPETYGIGFGAIPNEPYFARIDIDSQIDLKLAAELAGLRPEALFELNPAFHRWATPPGGPHNLLLPLAAADLFRQNLAQLTPDERMRVTHHIVKPGETLASIARHYESQPLTIRMLNNLGEGPLVAGTDLRVPSGSTVLPDKVLRAAARIDNGSQSAQRRPTVHVVRRGESIWTIARRNNMDPKTLLRLNNMRASDTLPTGKRLVVSTRSAPPTTPQRAPTSTVSTAKPAEARTVQHTVRSGDTLYRIAKIYQVTVAQIASWNGITANMILRPGQKLNINLGRRL